MSYAILDNNRFYAEGLRYALQRRGVQLEVHCDIVQWQPLLVTSRGCRPLSFFRCGYASGADKHFAQIGSRTLERQPLSGLQREGMGTGNAFTQALRCVNHLYHR